MSEERVIDPAPDSHPPTPPTPVPTPGAAHGPMPAPPPGYDQPVYVESRLERVLTRVWTKPAWLAPLAIFGCVAAASTYVLTNDPADDKPDPLGPCAFKALTGYDCPGCGGTRMVWYLLHGNLGEAARHHLLAFLAVPVLLYAYVAMVFGRIFGIKLPTREVPVGVLVGYGIAWALFSVARNLPWPPFTTFYV